MSTPPTLPYATDNADLVAAPWRRTLRFPRLPPLLLSLGIFGWLQFLAWCLTDAPMLNAIRDPWPASTVIALFSPVILQKRSPRILLLSFITFVILLTLSLIAAANRWDTLLNQSIVVALAATVVLAAWLSEAKAPWSRRALPLGLSVMALAGSLYLLRVLIWSSSEELAANSLHAVLPFYLFLTLTWIAATWLRKRQTPTFPRTPDHVAIAFACLLLVLAPLYHFGLETRLAERTIRTGGPLSENRALELLIVTHHTPNARLWELLADSRGNPHHRNDAGSMWRENLINYLVAHDPSASDHLSAILRSDPAEEMARLAAPTLAKSHRYETIPLLLRYAVVQHSGPCIDALVDMGVPQAAHAVVHDAIRTSVLVGEHATKFSPDDDRRLTALFGSLRPPWQTLLDHTARGHHPPIPDPILDDADRIVVAMEDYIIATGDLFLIRRERITRRVHESGLDADWNRYLRLRDEHPDTALDDAVRLSSPLHEMVWRINRETTISPPDWNVRTTPALEHEIQLYRDRIAKLRPPTTAPRP